MKRTLPNFFNILFALLIMGWSSSAFTQGYSGGSGIDTDPYQIQFFDDLQYLSENPGDWGSFFIQTADIDTTAAYYLALNGGAGFSPIGDGTTNFTGSYDGQNHTISNLYINRPGIDEVGLFGNAPGDFTGVTVKNLGLVNVNITGGAASGFVGALGGAIWHVENCYVTGVVNGDTYFIGGLAGYIQYCYNSYSKCTVNGSATSNYVGGLAGEGFEIQNCYATGNVKGNNSVGGFLGTNSGGTIRYCYSTGNVTGIGVAPADINGFVGLSSALDEYTCFWDKETSGQASSSGSAVGKTTTEMKRVGTYLSDPSLVSPYAPWDFKVDSVRWAFNGADNNGYPFLRMEGYTPGDIWLGDSSSVWGDTDNWSEGALPVAGDTVFIPDVLANDPILIALAEMHNLTVETGGFLNLASTGQLTVNALLKNDVGNAGLVLDPDASLVNGTADVSGTVKRVIANDGRWHFLSCPISQTLMPEICDNAFAPFSPDFFNSTTGVTYDFFYWQEPPAAANLNWINLKMPDWSTNTTDFGSPPRFVAGKGYLVEYSSSFAGDTMKTFWGVLGAGSLSIPVTNTAGGNWSGFNLIGNNYPSSIDWNATTGWGRTPLEDNAGGKDFWIWNDAVGNYGVYNSVLGEIGGPNGVSQYIPPTQAFFVKASTGGNVTMDDQVRCHSTQSWLKSDDNTLRIGAVSSVTSYSDEVLLVFYTLANGGSDKLFSLYEEAPSLYLPVDNNDYSIRFLDDVASNPAIPMSFKAGKDGNYTINITGTAKFSNVYLQDLKTGSTQDVKVHPAYSFISSTTDDANRFLIRFNPLGVDPKQSGNDNVFVYNNVLNVNNPGESVVTVYNMMGTKILEKQTNNESIYQLPLQLPTGYYIVKVTNGKVIYSEKVFVK